MSVPLKPRLRDSIGYTEDAANEGFYILNDQLHIATPLRVPGVGLLCMGHFDGERTATEVQEEIFRVTGDFRPTLELVEMVVKILDEALYLDSERLHEHLNSPIRPPSCIGSYPADADDLRETLEDLFTAPGGAGLPESQGCRIESDGLLRAVLVPHIDYGRGGITYGFGFRELVERTNAKLFVILGTSHYSAERFTLTRRNYSSPLGVVETDQKFIDALVHEYGDGLFRDPLAHVPEHSIELEVVLLQYLLPEPFRIVPLLVGSFSDCDRFPTDPSGRSDIQKMVEALRKVEATWPEPICYIISGDLAHIGPKFDDPEPVSQSFLAHSELQDRKILDAAEAGDASEYHRIITREGDSRRICGRPPTWVTMQAAGITSGKLLHYGRYVHPTGFESVSFVSMCFE